MKNTWNLGECEIGDFIVPSISTKLTLSDKLKAVFVRRIGMGRDHFSVPEGLYAVGSPDKMSPVIVTSNYKITFDIVRSNLSKMDAWLLLIDTKGVNVWCAASKGSFGTEEIIKSIKKYNIEKIIDHKTIILPQLGATGVSGFKITQAIGFKVVFGPVRANDIYEFVSNGYIKDGKMKQVMFPLLERAVLAPLEFFGSLKYMLYLLLGIWLVLAFVNGTYNVPYFIEITGIIAIAYIVGIFISPITLPYIPFKAFSLKGVALGILSFMPYLYLAPYNSIRMAGVFFISVSIISFVSMNFSGCTTYTCQKGAEKEVLFATPLHFLSLLTGVILFFKQV